METPFRRIWHHVYSRMLTGIVFVVPAILTIWVLQLLYGLLDGPLRSLLNLFWRPAFGWELPPGVGLVLTLLLLYGSGVLAANVFGRRFLEFGESLLQRMPLVNSIYNSARQVVRTLSRSEQPAFQRVVLVEFPSPGLWTVAFQVGTIQTSDGRQWVRVYVPTTPNPTSGFLQFLPKENVHATSVSVEDALKMVVSGGILAPEQLDMGLSKIDQSS
ncbi:DUF502 domain-containing protein [Candidatus Acetothermia bacterium]|jgi:uncharacterized membrane protein|nr:DUF502 domain-containing protein [Candidatus Acetothermia bacterium]MCI2431436.1 DUF502 domain-containing protein [Candidatus Acetothermia bacterium]MCI2437144.1 DUF502 domain-containing protein [Candidatus Acetothermia bacterium]